LPISVITTEWAKLAIYLVVYIPLCLQKVDMYPLVFFALLVVGINAIPHRQLEDRSPGNVSPFALFSAICPAADTAIAVGLIKLEKAEAFCTSLLNVKS